MKSQPTNRTKNSILGSVPQADLHVKVLDFMVKRVKPEKDDLYFEKGACKTCICEDHKAGQSSKSNNKKSKQDVSVKKSQPAAKKSEAEAPKFNNAGIRTSFIPEQSKAQPQFYRKSPSNHDKGTHLPLLGLQSKIISIRIDSLNSGKGDSQIRHDFQIQSSQKATIQKLRLQLIEKQDLITRLQKELFLSKKNIQELNQDIEGIRQLARNKVYSDDHLYNNQAMSGVSLDSPSLKEVIMTADHPSPNPSMRSAPSIEENLNARRAQGFYGEEYFWRFIKTQARLIEKQEKIQ